MSEMARARGEAPGHQPVLLAEVLALLSPLPGERAVDLTLGRGGHARALLERLLPAEYPVLLALDRDAAAIEAVQASWPGELREACEFVQARFSQLPELAVAHSWLPADLLLADLGVSSPQLDQAERGFAFQEPGPLDMRMDASTDRTARDLLAELSEAELARILWEYGEERYSRRIARAIKQALAEAPQTALQTTTELAELVKRATPSAPPSGKRGAKGKAKAKRGGPRIHPATRTFQALRIALNEELDELDQLLAAIPRLLAPGGRAAVISFHSLEDRRVKHALRELARSEEYELLTKKPLTASEAERAANPRARSAKLRGLRRRSG